MLSQQYRFHSRGGVNFVRQKGRSLRTPYFALTYMLNDRGFRRFAVVVSRKVDKRAVFRNRVRRRVYEAIRLEFPSHLPKMDCIFTIYNRNIENLPFSDLRRLVAETLDRAARDLSPRKPDRAARELTSTK